MEKREMSDSGDSAEERDEEIMLVEDEETKQETAEEVQEQPAEADAEAVRELNNQ